MPRTLIELITEELGVDVDHAANPEETDIDTTAKIILKQSPNRVGFVMVNLSANVMFVAPAADVSSSKGIRLAANGGSLTTIWREDFHLPALEWSAIADVNNSTLYTLEIRTV